MTYEILVPSFMQSLKTRELIMTGRRARRRISRWSVSPISSISFFFLLSCFSLLICSARGTITPTRQVIRDGETLISAGKKFELVFFNPGGATSTTNKRYLGIWYYGLSHDIPRTVVWVANGENPAVNTLASLAISRNGNLEVLDDIGNVLWSTSVFNITTNSTSTKLMDSGNLILSGGENEDDNIIWQSFSQESDTFLPGMKMDVNKKLRSWANEHDPAPGNLTFELNQDGNQIRFVIRNTSAIHWRSGSTNDFSNSNQMPEFVAYMLSNFSATSRRETPLKSPSPRFHIPNPSPSYVFNNLRLVMHPSGEIRFYNLSNNKLSWDLLWKGPSDNCSVYNVCGDYGSCNSTNKPVCKCLQGFIPKSRENWDSGEFSGGCIRKLPGCEKDDEFLQLKVKNVGNPYFNYSPQAQEECKAECLSKCSCNAYSFSNNSRRGRGVSSTCWIWNDEDLKDLQEGVSDRSKDIYVRVASSDLEPICKSNKDCEHWPDSTCLPSTTGNGKRRCLCNTNHAWDSSSKSCTRAVDSTLNKTHPSEPDHSAHNTKTLSSIVGVTVATGIILSFAIIFVCYLKRRKRRMDKRKAHRENIQEGSTSHFDESDKYAEQIDSNKFGIDEKKGIDVPFYDFESIMEATENFSKSNKLGQGGFGPVYKGKFLGGEEMAVKRLSRSSGQGLQEFKNEVLLIAKLQHRNLVKLLGYSIKGDEYMLLYEYMPNKSLDFFIFDPTRCLLLNWEKRFNIIMGIARGLLYLHQDSRLRIIHRDLKTSNILLDEEMNPKISDFGLARIFGGNQTEANTNRVVGTYGYMSPEYALNGIFSDKSDVFSFGIVLLEIVSGKKNTGTGVYQTEHSLSLLATAWTLWKEDKVLDLMDKSLCEAFNAFEVSKCINIGLLCVQDDADDRPTMSNVVFMLGSETTTLPTPKQPAFVGKMGPSNTASSSSKPETYSVTELTITAEQGR